MSEISAGQDAKDLAAWDTYQQPTGECDVVMKGGITSGVLYPLAVCELASTYRLRSVGGTSAGAIAAAAAAAAEHGRASDSSAAGYQGLAALPDWLGSGHHLQDLFRPPAETRGVHRVLMRFVKPKKNWPMIAASVVVAGFTGRRMWMPVAGAMPGLICLLGLVLAEPASWWTYVAIAVAIVLAAVGLLVGSAASLVLTSGEKLDKNMYGIVAGSSSYDGQDSLSDWLVDQIDTLAGRPTDGPPLTFGDLWAGPDGTGTPAAPHVNLEMLTTNVTQGRPVRLPDDLGPGYCFTEREFRLLFPDRVVRHLKEKSGGPVKGDHLIPLPHVRDLPVVVATRMSLSFPLLISAVPLHAVDFSMPEKQHERVWFSDGGITSNFPISFFDSMLPTRPTFGINLRKFHERYPKNTTDERANVWMPRTNSAGQLEWWSRWPQVHGIKGVGRFLRAIADTMQNWVDNTQTRVPGYRDRIVHISHDDTEGGMNLAMPPSVLEKLSERGRCAGQRLVDYYTHPPGAPLEVDELYADEEGPASKRVVSWENHRRIRLRTSLSLVTAVTGLLVDGYDATYRSDLDARGEDVPSYPFTSETQHALARAVMNGASDPTVDGGRPLVRLSSGLVQLTEEIRAVEARSIRVPLVVGSPRPAPVLRIWPGGGPSARVIGAADLPAPTDGI